MSKPKYIRDWEELSKEESETYTLVMDDDYSCGWLEPIKSEFGKSHYLSTHTFYGSNYKYCTELLQSCGFNVVLANWDEKRDKKQ